MPKTMVRTAKIRVSHARLSSGVRDVARRAFLAAFLIVSCASSNALKAQQPQTAAPNAGWQTGTTTDPKVTPNAPAAPGNGWSNPGNVTVVPRATPDAPANPSLGEVTVSALIAEDGEPIEQGIVWHVYQIPPAAKAAVPGKPRLVGSWKDAAPALKLPAGQYLVNASFGRAHLTRKIEIVAGARRTEQFILNAGGLRLMATLTNGEPAPANSVTFDVYVGEGDQASAGTKVVTGAKPGLILRLNAGIYQIVSTYGDTNAVVRGDVTVEAGKLSEAVVQHNAARITLKLVPRAGGEAIADTQWILQTPQGETVRESLGALPSHVLAAGRYVVIAKNGGRVYKREFNVAAGNPLHVEIVME